jgi:imidazolonepropionase
VKIQIWRNIGILLSLEGAAKKSARRINDQDLGFIKKAAIVAQGGIIQWVGPERKLPSIWFKRASEVIDSQGQTALPCWVECHTHSLYAGHRYEELEMRNRGLSYSEITEHGGGIYSTVRATHRASSRELKQLTQQRVNHFLSQGVGVIEIKTGYGLTPLQELRQLKILNQILGPEVVPTFLGAHAVYPKGSSSEKHLQKLLAFASKVRKFSSRADIFVERGFFERDKAFAYLKKLKSLGFDLTLHADQLSDSGGVELGIQLGALSVDHVLKTKRSSLKKLANSETTAVLLPVADFYLKCPYPRARELIEMGARVALSTDFNPGTSPCSDLNFLGVLSRLELKLTLPEVIVAMSLGAAYALGRGHKLGALTPGRSASLQLLQSDWSELFYSMTEPMRASGVWHRGEYLFGSESFCSNG